jgi:hypothetical protein
VVGLALLFVVAGLGASRWCFHPVQIRGVLSQTDLAEISRLHRVWCPTPALCPRWLPVSVRSRISALLSPIEIIATPQPAKATVVYRGYDNYYYDRKGKPRRQWVSYTLAKDASGWHYVLDFP